MQRFAIPFVTKGNLLAVGDGSQNDGGSSRAATDKTDNFSGMANGAAQSILDESALSIDMSIDWSPPESRLASRRNTFFAVSRDSKYCFFVVNVSWKNLVKYDHFDRSV